MVPQQRTHHALSCITEEEQHESRRSSHTQPMLNASAIHSNSNSNTRKDPSDINSVLQNVPVSDRRLFREALTASVAVPWEHLRHEPSSITAAQWKPRTRDGVLQVYTQEKQSNSFTVLAKGLIPCNVQELRQIFRTPTSEFLCALMGTIYRNDFVDGEVLHHVNVNPIETDSWANASYTSVKSTASTQSGSSGDNNNERRKPGAGFPLEELCVQALMFGKPNIFSSMKQWRLVDLIRSTMDQQRFTKTIMTLSPKDGFSNSPSSSASSTSSRVKYGHGLLASYSFEGEPGGRNTRVIFYGQYTGSSNHQQRSRAPWAGKHLSDRVVKTRLIRMAESTRQFIRVVQRRRLGMQVMADIAVIQPTNRQCMCCQRSMKYVRKTPCQLCGVLVCDKCLRTRELEYRIRRDTSISPQIDQVKVCERCIVRVDECSFAGTTDADLLPVVVIPDEDSMLETNTSNVLRFLLEKALTNTPTAKQESVKTVMKYLEDESDAKTRISTTMSLNSSRIRLQQQATSEDYYITLDNYVLGSHNLRNYPILYPDDGTQPIFATIPIHEANRLEVIRKMEFGTLDGIPDLDAVCSIVADQLNCMGTFVTIVRDDTFHVIASTLVPLAHRSFPRNQGFCTQLLMDVKPLIATHVQADIRFSQIPAVKALDWNFYCGFPLVAADDTVIGSVCYVDQQFRDFTQSDYAVMKNFADTASKLVQRAVDVEYDI